MRSQLDSAEVSDSVLSAYMYSEIMEPQHSKYSSDTPAEWGFSCTQTLQAGGGLIYAVVHWPDIHGCLSQGKLLRYSCKTESQTCFSLLFFIYSTTISNEGKSNKCFRFESLCYHVIGAIDPPHHLPHGQIKEQQQCPERSERHSSSANIIFFSLNEIHPPDSPAAKRASLISSVIWE